MHASYAAGRRKAPHLNWRYRYRAFTTVEVYRGIGSPRPASRVLDLGAAEGLTLLEIRRLLGERGTFDGVELSDSLLEQAANLPADTRLVRGDVMQLPAGLEPESYDLVVALAVLEHLPDPLACVREAARMLRRGGVFVASCPNPVWDKVAGALGLVHDEYHEQLMTAGRMVDLCGKAGLESITYRPFMWAPVATLPYLRVPVRMSAAASVDRLMRALRIFGFTFVNQLVAARRPAA
jgi:SAM-dependent methyltransferase